MHDYNLRNNRNRKLHQSTTNVRFFSIKCNEPRIWNDIDISIRDARHVDIFKAKLKQHYLVSYIWPIITGITFCIRDIQFITDLF